MNRKYIDVEVLKETFDSICKECLNNKNIFHPCFENQCLMPSIFNIVLLKQIIKNNKTVKSEMKNVSE